MQPGRARAHTHVCRSGHQFDSGNPDTHYTTRSGQVRYVCPTCMSRPGWRLPRGWEKANPGPKAAPARPASPTAYWPF